jgi:hypothetical protein
MTTTPRETFGPERFVEVPDKVEADTKRNSPRSNIRRAT